MGRVEEKGLVVAPSSRMATQGQCPGGVAMETGPAGYNLILVGFSHLAPILPNEFNGRFYGLGAAGQKMNPVQPLIGGHRTESFRAFHGRFACKMASVGEGQPVGLGQHGFTDFGNAVTNTDHGGPSGPIDIAPAIDIPDKYPLCPIHNRICLAGISIKDMVLTHPSDPLSEKIF